MTAANFFKKSEQDAAARDAKNKADMAAMAGGSSPPAKPKQADPSRFSEEQYVRRNWIYTLRNDETIDDARALGFFKNIAMKANLGDIVYIRSADLTLESKFTVVSSDDVTSHLQISPVYESKVPPATKREFEGSADYEIKESGDVIKRIEVFRIADAKLMRSGFRNRQDAQHYISTELTDRRLAS